MVTDAIAEFLMQVPPFQFLTGAELRELIPAMSLEYFPKSTRILSAGDPASDILYVIQKGGVKLVLPTPDGAEVVLDLRSEGEVFGLLSLMGGDVARLDVTAIEDTLCYCLPKTQVQQLLTNPDVAGYLLRTSVTRYVDRSLSEIQARSQALGDGERLLYSLAARDVLTKPLIACGEKVPLQRAAQIMAEAAATYVVVLAPDSRAAGILTDHDLALAVAHGNMLTIPVDQVMSHPVIAIEGRERVFQALVQMIGRHIHHVLVTQDGLPIGVLSNHDLLLLQGKSPLSLGQHIARQATLEQLAQAQERINDLIPLLLREGARAGHITRVLAEINDQVLAKVLALAEEHLGPPPVSYCWVMLGSEGRREQTFKTDQDNGLIYDDAADPERTAAAENYFTRFSTWVRDGLARCGYPPCPGDYMASNPRWRLPLAQWQTYYTCWITEPERRRVLDALIFFDMRPVADDCGLFASLAETRRQALVGASRFKSILAYLSILHRPPLGFFRTFVVERGGQHKNQLDLKLFGTGPIVNAARLFALDAGIEQTNTLGRLAALQDLGYGDRSLFQDLAEAWDFLMLLRLQRQLAQSEAHVPVGNYVDPGALTNLQRSLLKEAFRTIARAQSVIEANFQSGIWAHLG